MGAIRFGFKGCPAVVWLSRLWGDLLISGSSKGKTLKESGHTSWASIELAASPVDTPPSFPHLLGTLTVPITCRRQFLIFVVLLIIALVVNHCHERGSGGGLSHRHRGA